MTVSHVVACCNPTFILDDECILGDLPDSIQAMAENEFLSNDHRVPEDQMAALVLAIADLRQPDQAWARESLAQLLFDLGGADVRDRFQEPTLREQGPV